MAGMFRVRSLRCGEQFRIMAFAQMTYRESLRDIRKHVSERNPRSYMAWGCAKRWHVRHWPMPTSCAIGAIWAELAAVLVRRARKIYTSAIDIGLDLANTVYALDSTTIDLCLSLFPWADFRRPNAVKMHHACSILRGPIPSFIHFRAAKWAMLQRRSDHAGRPEPLCDGSRLRRFFAGSKPRSHQPAPSFVTRTKSTMKTITAFIRVPSTRGTGFALRSIHRA